MTDLSQFIMAPLEPSSDASSVDPTQVIPEPNYAKFSEWKEDNATGDDAKDYQGYANFVRKHHLDENTWNPAVEIDLRNNYESALAGKGLLDIQDTDQVRQLYAPKEIPLESRLQTITNTRSSDSEEWQKATAYLSNEKAIAKMGMVEDPEYIERRAQLKAEAEEVAYSPDWDKSVIDSVNTGNLIAARVTDSAGNSVIRLGRQAKGMGTKEIIESSKHLGIDYNDAMEIEAANSPMNAKGTTYAEQRRYVDLADKLNVLLTNEDAAGTSHGTMQVDREGRMLAGMIHTNVDDKGYFFGPDKNTIEASPHNRANKYWESTIESLATYDNSRASGDQTEIERAKKVYESNIQNLGYILEQTGLVSDKGEVIDMDDLKVVVEQAAAGAVSQQNKWAFQDDPDKLKYNLKDYGYEDPVIHGAAIPRKQMFDAIIEANPQLSEQQVANLTQQRKNTLENNFDMYDQILSQGNTQDEWQEAVQVGLADGKSNGTILEEFVQDDDNYSELSSRIGGVAMSIPNALGSAIAALPAIMGSETAQNYLQKQIKNNENRRAAARLFGIEMGMGQDIAEMVAPVITDVAITGLLSVTSAGAGGAAYLTAKTGAKITAKGLAKGIVTNAFKVTGRESAEQALDRLIRKGFVTAPTTSGRKGAMDVIEKFSKMQASKLNTIPAMAIPAFNRSAGMTYATTYAALEDSGLSHEEKHDRAVGAGLVAGSFTGLITGAFGALGAGGVEKAFLSGMSKKQATNVISRLSARGKQVADAGKQDELLAGVLKEATKKSVYGNSKYGLKDTFIGEVLKDASQEGAEEFIDEFINGVVQDFYTDQDTPMLDRITGAGWAALAGGIFGGAMPTGARVIQNIRGTTDAVARAEEAAVQQSFINDVTSRLNEKGAPVSAEIVEQILTVPMGEVDAARAAYDRYTEARGQDGDAGPTGVPDPTPEPSGPTEAAPTQEETEAEPTPVEVPEGEQEFDQSIPPTPTVVSDLSEGESVLLPNGNVATVVTIKEGVKVRDKTYSRVVGLSNGVVIPSEDGSDTINTIVFPQESPVEQGEDPIEVDSETVAPREIGVVEPSVEKSEPFIRQRVAKLIRQNGVVEAGFVAQEIEAITDGKISESDAAITISENYVVDSDDNIVGVIDPDTNEQIGVDQATQDVFTIMEELDERTPEDWERASREAIDEEKFERESAKAPIQLDFNFTEESNEVLDLDVETSTISPASLDILSPPPTPREVINLQSVGINPEEVTQARSEEAYKRVLEEDISEPVLQEGTDEVMELSEEIEELVGLGDPNDNAPKIQRIIDLGYPVRINSNQNHGLVLDGDKRKNYSRISDYIATQIHENSPWIEVAEPVGGRTITTQDTKAATWYHPVEKKSTRRIHKAYVDAEGKGVFDNNPLTMALLEEAEIPFSIPLDMDPSDVNKAFEVDYKEGRRVTMIRKPDALEDMQISTKSKAKKSRDTIEDTSTLEKYMTASYIFSETKVGELAVDAASIPSGPSTMRVIQEGETVSVSEVIESTDSYVSSSLNSSTQGSFFNLMTPRGRDLDENYLSLGSLSVQAEMRYYASTRAVRMEMLRGDSNTSVLPYVQQNKEGKYELNQKNELAARTKLLQTFMEFTDLPKNATGQKRLAKQVAPMLAVNRVSNNSLETISNYVLDEIINNEQTSERMPIVEDVAKLVSTRMGVQQRYDAKKRRKESVQIVEIDAASDENAGVIDLDREVAADYERASINELSPNRDDVYATSDESASIILSSIDEKKGVRTQLEKLVLGSVMRDTPTNRKKIRKTPSKELMRLVQGWLDQGRQNQKVKEFKDRLKAQKDPEIIKLHQALKNLNITTASSDGNMSQDSGYKASFQKNIKNGADAGAFAKENTRVRRSRMAKSRVSQAGQAMANALNTAEANRLGLVSGNPESVIKALQNIAKNKSNKQHALVAELLLENPAFIKSVDFDITELNLSNYAGLYTKYTDGSHGVTINLNGHNGKGLTNVLLEEYLHATLSDAFAKPKDSLSTKQQEAMSRLENLMGEIRQAAADNGYAANSPIMDSLGNIDEFIAGVMLSNELQQEILALGKSKNAKKSFFKRIGDAILRFFERGVTSAEAAEYSDAIVDVITVKAGAGVEASAKTAAKRIAKAAMTRMDRNNMMLRAIGFNNMRGYEDRAQTQRVPDQSLNERERQALNSSIEQTTLDNEAEVDALVETLDQLDVPDDSLSLTEAQQKLRTIIQHMRNLIPPEVNLAFDTESSGPAKMQGGMVYINPQNIFQLTKDMDVVSSRLLMSAVIEEELAHVASYNALPQSEIDELASTLNSREFDRIIDNYFTTNQAKRADAKALLATEITSDMTPEERSALEQEILDTKRMLVEEHLRSVGQRITRGYTTEEDHAFYKTNPSMIKILFRYVSGLFKRLAASRAMGSMDNKYMSSAVNRLVDELRAIKRGYRLAPTHLNFDPSNPDNSFVTLAAILNDKMVSDPEDFVAELRAVEGLNALPDIIPKKKIEFVRDLTGGLVDYPEQEEVDRSQQTTTDIRKTLRTSLQERHRRVTDARRSIAEEAYENALKQIPRETDEVPEEFYEAVLDDVRALVEETMLSGSDISPLTTSENIMNTPDVDQQRGILAEYIEGFNHELMDPNTMNLKLGLSALEELNADLDMGLAADFGTSRELTKALDDTFALYIRSLRDIQQDKGLSEVAADDSLLARLNNEVSSVEVTDQAVGTTDVSKLREALSELEGAGYMEIITDELSLPTSPTMEVAIGEIGSRSLVDFSIDSDGSIYVGSMAPITLDDEFFMIGDRVSKGELTNEEADVLSAQIEQLKSEGGRVTPVPNTVPLLVQLIAANGEIKAPAIKTQGAGSGQIVNMSMARRNVLTTAVKKAEGIDANKKAKMIQDLQSSGAMTKGYDAWAKWGFENTDKDLSDFKVRLESQLPIHIHNEFSEWLATAAPQEYVSAMVDVVDTQTFQNTDVVMKVGKNLEYSFALLGNVRKVHDNADADVVAYIEDNFERIKKYHKTQIAKLQKMATTSKKTWSVRKVVQSKGGLGLWRNYGWDQQFVFDLDVGSDAMKQFNVKYTPVARRALRSSLEADSSIEEDSINMAGFIKTLEMPVYTTGDYNAPRKWYQRLFRGEVDPRITDLHKNRLAFLRASDLIVTKYKRKMDKLVKKAFNGEPNDYQKEMLEKAIGDAKGIVLPSATLESIEKVHEDELKAIRDNKDLTNEQAEAAEEASKLRRRQAVQAEEIIARDEILRTKDEKMAELELISPELAQHIRDIRKELIQPLSTYIKDNFGLNEDLQARIDMNMDFYITRSYRMFTDSDYASKVQKDPAYHEVREAAKKYFEKQYVKDKTAELKKNDGLTETEAKARAEAMLRAADDSGHPKGQRMLDEFLESYQPHSMSSLAKNHSESHRIMIDNLKQKKDLDISLRNLLGEYGQDGTVDNLLRTFSTVAKMSANQSFINNVAKMGKAEGFLITQEERAADMDQYRDWVPMRNTNEDSDGDPLAGFYAPPELRDGFDKTFDRTELRAAQTKAEEVIASFGRFSRAVTGLSMASKTLGSVGFFVRNAFSNMAFFGPSQGYYKAAVDVPLIMLKRSGVKAQSAIRGEQIEEALIEYTSLGIIGDEVRGQMMLDLMRGKTTPDILMEEQMGVLSKIKKGTKPAKYLYEKAAELASAIDAFYKIGYFEHELKILRKASAEPNSNIPTDEYQLKRLAAKKVKMTAQSHSEAPPFITGLSQSNFGMLFAPFIRFKAEVPRIVMNTYRLSFEEMRSGNKVLRRRGINRFASMNIMLGVWSTTVPAVLQHMAGIGEEEDESMRAGIPSYLRGHSFWFFRDKETNELTSLDLTFSNPYSLLGDPALRMIEDVRRGEYASGAGKLITGFLTDQYLDPQILASSLIDISENRNASNDNPIVETRTDDALTKMGKRITYVLKEAYGPDIYKRFKKLYESKDVDPTLLRKEDMPLQIMIDQFKPFKAHTVDVEQQYRRYLYELREEYDRVSSQKYKSYSRRPMSEDALGQLYHDEVAKRKIIQNDLVRISRGYRGLGMTDQKIYNAMTSSGVSKRRARNTFYGVMDKPKLGPKFFKGLYDKSQGPNPTMTEEQALNRAGAIYRAMASYRSRYIELDEKF